MPFILILIGLLLVYLGLKMDKKNVDNGCNGQFNTILDNKFIEDDMNNIRENIKDLASRTQSLEQSIILIYDKLNSENNSSDSIKSDDTKNSNLSITTTENQIEKVEETEKIEEEVKVEEKSDVNSKIYYLSNQGKTVDEIASLLKIGKGEILLRLGLKNQRDSF